MINAIAFAFAFLLASGFLISLFLYYNPLVLFLAIASAFLIYLCCYCFFYAYERYQTRRKLKVLRKQIKRTTSKA